MKMNIHSAILAFILPLSLLFSCGGREHDPHQLSARLSDTNVAATIPLQEGDIPLTNISSASYSLSRKLLVISDEPAGHVFLFEAETGALVHTFSGSIDLTDSLALKATPYDKNLRFQSLKEISDSLEGTISEEYRRTWLQHTYTSAYFLNDSTLALLGVIQGILQNIRGRFQKVSHGQTTLFSYNLKSHALSVQPFSFLNREMVAQPHTLFIPAGDSLLLASTTNEWAFLSGKYDSMWTLAYFDRRGNGIRGFFSLPEEYRNPTMAYNALNISLCSTANSQLFASCVFVPAIFNLTTNQRHPLKSIPYSNNDGLRIAATSASVPPDSLIRLLPVRLIRLDTVAGNHIVASIQIYDRKTGERRWTVQEYSERMELVRNVPVHIPGRFGSIEYVIPSSDTLRIFSLSSDGWTLVKKPW